MFCTLTFAASRVFPSSCRKLEGKLLPFHCQNRKRFQKICFFPLSCCLKLRCDKPSGGKKWPLNRKRRKKKTKKTFHQLRTQFFKHVAEPSICYQSQNTKIHDVIFFFSGMRIEAAKICSALSYSP